MNKNVDIKLSVNDALMA